MYIYTFITFKRTQPARLIAQIKSLVMKNALYVFLIGFVLFSYRCSNVNPDAVDLEVDFS